MYQYHILCIELPGHHCTDGPSLIGLLLLVFDVIVDDWLGGQEGGPSPTELFPSICEIRGDAWFGRP